MLSNVTYQCPFENNQILLETLNYLYFKGLIMERPLRVVVGCGVDCLLCVLLFVVAVVAAVAVAGVVMTGVDCAAGVSCAAVVDVVLTGKGVIGLIACSVSLDGILLII